MNLEESLYRVGELAESIWKQLLKFIFPEPKENPPRFKVLKKIIRRKVSVHEMLSLKLQLSFILYLVIALLLVLFTQNVLYLTLLSTLYFLYIRAIISWNRRFFIEYEPYRAFYYGLTGIAFASYLGYLIMRRTAPSIYYFYGYLVAIFVAVFLFRYIFRAKYRREWTYGVVEEVKGDLVKISTHDDIRANIKPGEYWVDRSEKVEVGSVVKVLVEEHILRGAVPKRIMEVYESSKTSTEPKAESDSNSNR
ncbi:DUF2101 family protein [Palaeococcus sp. (in: euryarchaeotes)]